MVLTCARHCLRLIFSIQDSGKWNEHRRKRTSYRYHFHRRTRQKNILKEANQNRWIVLEEVEYHFLLRPPIDGAEDARRMREPREDDVAMVARSSCAGFDRSRAAGVRLRAIPRADKRGGRSVGDWPVRFSGTGGFRRTVPFPSQHAPHQLCLLHRNGDESVRDSVVMG